MYRLLLVPLLLQAASLDPDAARAMAGRQGSLVALDVRTGRLLAAYHPEVAARRLAKPGSTVKPFTLEALLNFHLATGAPCIRTLLLRGRNLACTHPGVPGALSAAEALAYSCNSWFAAAARRLPGGALAEAFDRAGLTKRTRLLPREATGLLRRPLTAEGQQLQALGEQDIMVTPLGLLGAYRQLALSHSPATLEGLIACTTYGTGRFAHPRGSLAIAGKTGTATSDDGLYKHGWFAGFAPARHPEIVLVVYLERGQGGGDAAPIASEIFEAWLKQR